MMIVQSNWLVCTIYIASSSACTGWHKKNAANFQLKKAWFFFFRSIFLNFYMHVAMVSNIIYKKSKKSRRPGRGYQPPRRGAPEIGSEAHDYSFPRKKVGNFRK